MQERGVLSSGVTTVGPLSKGQIHVVSLVRFPGNGPWPLLGLDKGARGGGGGGRERVSPLPTKSVTSVATSLSPYLLRFMAGKRKRVEKKKRKKRRKRRRSKKKKKRNRKKKKKEEDKGEEERGKK